MTRRRRLGIRLRVPLHQFKLLWYHETDDDFAQQDESGSMVFTKNGQWVELLHGLDPSMSNRLSVMNLKLASMF